MTQRQVTVHPMQVTLRDKIVDKFGDFETSFGTRYPEISQENPNHHALYLIHGVEETLKVRGEENVHLETIVFPGHLHRVVLSYKQKGYVAIEESDTKPIQRAVVISLYVYPEELAFIGAPKEATEDDARKTAKVPVKTEANIPIVFIEDEKSTTRHYQENKPMTTYKGMTNRLIETLVDDIVAFLDKGVLPVDLK